MKPYSVLVFCNPCDFRHISESFDQILCIDPRQIRRHDDSFPWIEGSVCGGMEFQKKAHRLQPGELFAAIRGSGAGVQDLRVYFPNPKAALLADPEQDIWLPWGRRKDQEGDWPEGGWARQESLAKPYWQRWRPAEILVHPLRWMEKDPGRTSHWFELRNDQGILCLRLDGAPGTPLYVVTAPATGDFLADIHDRIPVIVG